MIDSLWSAVLAAVITMLATGLGGLPFVFLRSFPWNLARLAWAVGTSGWPNSSSSLCMASTKPCLGSLSRGGGSHFSFGVRTLDARCQLRNTRP